MLDIARDLLGVEDPNAAVEWPPRYFGWCERRIE